MNTDTISLDRIEPYPVRETEDNTFYFTTTAGNEYQIYFARYWQQDVVDLYLNSRIPVYEFYFEVVHKSCAVMDKRIAPTIFSVVDDFVSRTNSVLFYITQRDDGRSKELFRVYQLWFNEYKRTRFNMLNKTDRAVWYGRMAEAYISCIYKADANFGKKNIEEMINVVLEEIYPNARVTGYQ